MELAEPLEHVVELNFLLVLSHLLLLLPHRAKPTFPLLRTLTARFVSELESLSVSLVLGVLDLTFPSGILLLSFRELASELVDVELQSNCELVLSHLLLSLSLQPVSLVPTLPKTLPTTAITASTISSVPNAPGAQLTFQSSQPT